MDQKPMFGKKWLWVGLIIAFLNPIFSGLVIGSLYLTEPGLKKYGRIILPLAVVQGEAGPAAVLAGKIKNDLGVEAKVPNTVAVIDL